MKFQYLVFAVLLISCSKEQKSVELQNTYWTTDILVDKSTSEFTPNMILSIGDSVSSIHQYGTGKKLFELPYEIKDESLILGDNSKPFLGFLDINDSVILGSLYPEDTTRFRRISPKSISETFISEKIENTSFSISSLDGSKFGIIYFDKKEVFQLSRSIGNKNSEFQKLQFERMPYSIDFTNSIPTIIIGNQRSPKVQKLENGELKLTNLIIGTIVLNANEEIEIHSYKPQKDEKYILSRIEKETEGLSLINSEWKRGENLIFNFKSSDDLEVKENDNIRKLKWNYDNSGYLIIMTEDSGDKLYAVNDFRNEEKRIGFELSKGKFMDVLRFSKK